jgi:hypothetical protein
MTEMTESKIRKILTDDIKWLTTIGTIIVSITVSYMALMNEVNVLKIKQDNLARELSIIQTNHLVHLQQSIDKVADRLSAHLEQTK